MSASNQRFTMTITKKLWLLALSTLLGIGALTAVLLISERSLILDERERGVREVVEMADSFLHHYQDLASKGVMSEEDAKQGAKEAIRALRYDGKEYFTIYDESGNIVMHPFNKALEGKDQNGLKDADGKFIVQEFVRVVKTDKAGFVSYVWPRPGTTEPIPKTAYLKGFAPWGWIIGSGVYMDSVQATFMGRAEEFLVAAVILAFSLTLITLMIGRSILRPLNVAIGVAQTVASGDLTSSIVSDGQDEAGLLLQSLSEMNTSLLHIVSQVSNGTDAISTASSQIASGNHDLSIRTEQQAASLQETASSMQQLTTTVRQNAENSREANQLAVAASKVAVRGGDVVARVVDTMDSINDSAKKIVDIIGVIDGIAFQTNILALNAAVEAARAGEQGRGFAVVASEVRSLAQRSAAAAKEIKSLIGDSVEKINISSIQVNQAGLTMEEIVISVKRVTDIMEQITYASQEQSSGLEQINHAISQMDDVTQQNAVLVEQATAASASLQYQADSLAQVVGLFKLGGRRMALLG